MDKHIIKNQLVNAIRAYPKTAIRKNRQKSVTKHLILPPQKLIINFVKELLAVFKEL